VRIGEALAGARRQADLTVAEVSERTRIRATIIRAIENDDYSACGGDFYARGHIRSIAKVVGADPELLIREYDTAHRASGVYSTVSLEELLASAAEAPQHRGPDWAAGRERAATAGVSLGSWLSRAGELAILLWATLRRWLSLAGEMAVLAWTTVRLRLSRSALGTAAGPALGRARHRLSRTAALGLVAAMFTTARLALSRSLRRGPNRPAAREPAARLPREQDELNQPTAREPAARLPRGRRGLNWSMALAVAALAVIGFGIYRLVSGPGQAVTPSAASQPAVTGQPSPHPAQKPSPTPAAPSPAAAAPVQQLVPVRAKAFGPRGGDHPQLASQVIRVHRAAGWHSDWYASARFGNLYGGTGLLLDMGHPVTLTSAQISLGPAHGASLQVRVGAAPALAAMPPVAHAVNTGGVVRLEPARPAHGRYVLIWFTKLPPDHAGTFRASVYHVSLQGRAH
jgi:transcriptional regulator with XRE-family HTH domain